ncbi:MAG TPA: hypothetical protein VK911_17435 [Vicinamibacterales bacterium]|nr:hypothetical protein [Vicinamibacterales bacterium]
MRSTLRLSLVLVLMLLAGAVTWGQRGAQECTTAIFTAAATPDGRPLLWKNRDTDTLSNKVVFVDDKPYSYLGVVNAEDTDGRMVWGGLNAAGLGIANSVAYNLPQRPGEQADLEGIIMADALRTCATVDQVERYFAANLGPDLGSLANFLVIDAQGGASIFEVHNRGFKRIDATAAPQGYMANTNFSRTGTADQGAGYLRFDRETALLEAAAPRSYTPAFVLQTLARDLGHPLLGNPAREEWKSLPADRPLWVHTNHTINRNSTASVLLVHGVKPGQHARLATLWVILGEPVTGVAVPLWVAAGTPPAELWEGKQAALTAEAFRLKDVLRPLKARERKEYADLTRLDNAAGTGWLPSLLEAERDTLDQVDRLVAKNPQAADLAAFQKAAAERALALLRATAR